MGPGPASFLKEEIQLILLIGAAAYVIMTGSR